jgi:hypothetical protein
MIERILQIIDYKGINKSIFYKNTGLSNGFLDKVKDIGASKLELILITYPEISMEWLLTGKGSMLKSVVQKEAPPPPEAHTTGALDQLRKENAMQAKIIAGLERENHLLREKLEEKSKPVHTLEPHIMSK